MIGIVLCPIDFSQLTSRELDLAVQVCEAFGSRLVLHHNVSAISPGFSKAWEWDREHQNREPSVDEAQERVNALLRQLPNGVHAEAVVTRGPLLTTVLALARELPADLLLLGTHGCSTEEHASLSERIIDQAPCPVLTIRDPGGLPTFRLKAEAGGELPRLVVPTDFSPSAGKAVAYAATLARQLPLRLDLLHVSKTPDTAAVLETLDDLVPSDLRDRVECHVRVGRAEEEIEAFLREVEPEMVVMGTHGQSFWRRLSGRDVARVLLHDATCPVCFVPPTTAC
jgi:nucleotide-binding universal stress UspA family protein